METISMLTQTVEPTKTERISIRLDPDTKQRIEQAAAIDHRSITSFIIASAVASADAILRRGEQMVFSEKDWDTFYQALIHPPKPNTALKNAFAAYRQLRIQSDV
jgi:uncharacterized protein (DUF1778 family)